ncbi:molecular chaperone DnaJ [bacterium (Candidatus Gribaldobacteria) CG08_land_8_20_14_0_20_39_15]|uniref:Chaperone protein DnaJ n=1 Tax=bacterium (Candidatus Gribaldobacteria) CG08_land_8_20_14_0_20_39_15 TaxID=2014273 RepID=A0A2M6XUS7_9BACT|nr:MAG: molecular chaperone DnaJ [bacterium (Candidatus Gribaldobacteria) CG08_land_8_20_14_0_20_39_15]
MSDYYQTLGINKTASQEEVKQAYHKLAHQYHPDKKGGNEKKFKEINEAYQILGNKEKRAQYDQFGRVFEGASAGGQSNGFGGFDFSSFAGGQGNNFDFGNFDFADIFSNLGFGVRPQKRKPKNKGADLEVEITIELKDTVKDLVKKISLSKMVKCSRCGGVGAEIGSQVKECFSCKGTGWVQQMKRFGPLTLSQDVICPECKGEGKIPEKPCNVCQGEGRFKEQEDIEVIVPAGVDTGQVLRVEGAGEAGKRGGEAGDLYVRISIKPHRLFERKGDNLFALVVIPFSLAALGGEIDLESLEGKKISLKIPAGSESGKVFRLSAKGIPHFNGWGRGDLFVELQVITPKKLSKKQKDLLEELRKEGL